MKRLFNRLWRLLTSRSLPPLVVGAFFLVYIGIAFFTEEALITLIALTRGSIFLAALLALIPLNSALRLVRDTVRQLRRRRALYGGEVKALRELFDESLDVPATPVLSELDGRLAAVGYTTRRTAGTLAAWRGFGVFPARMLFLAGSFCLFTGILISTTGRTSYRGMVIEGDPLPAPSGAPARVERIRLARSSGPILLRTLAMDVTPYQPGGSARTFELYPPSLFGGTFVYPRYLGASLLVRFSAPDLPQGFEKRSALNLYPPGKEGNVIIPESPYRITFSIAQPPEGEDRYVSSYMSERIPLQIKLIKGNDMLFLGSATSGGAFVRDGYRIEIPDVRRLVVTDFIRDYGVFCIWAAGLLYLAAVLLYLPLRFFFPRREMLFRSGPDIITAYCRAEGKGIGHAGVFHEALDLLETSRPVSHSLSYDNLHG